MQIHRNCFERFLVYSHKICTLLRLERLISVEDQPHQAKAGKKLHSFNIFLNFLFTFSKKITSHKITLILIFLINP